MRIKIILNRYGLKHVYRDFQRMANVVEIVVVINILKKYKKKKEKKKENEKSARN